MDSRYFPALVSLAAPALALLLAPPAFGQGEHPAHVSRLPIVVDGADTPEQIPDHLAYAHFILSMAQPDKPSTADTVRTASTLARLQLSDADVASLRAALAGVHKQLDFIDREVSRLSASIAPPSLPRLDTLRLQRTRVLDEATTRLITSLSHDGSTKLHDHIKTYVKPRIVIYGNQAQVVSATPPPTGE